LPIPAGWARCATSHVIEIFSRDRRSRVMTDGEPYLSAMSGVQIVRCARASHLGCYPTGLQSIGENIRPTACDPKSQKHIMQFSVGVRLLPLPWALLPREIPQACVAALVEASTQVDQALGLLYQRG